MQAYFRLFRYVLDFLANFFTEPLAMCCGPLVVPGPQLRISVLEYVKILYC